MQLDYDVDALLASLQSAAMRRGMYIGFVPARQAWCVMRFSDGRVAVGCEEKLEKIFDVLDRFPIVQDAPKIKKEGSGLMTAALEGSALALDIFDEGLALYAHDHAAASVDVGLQVEGVDEPDGGVWCRLLWPDATGGWHCRRP